MIELDIRNFKFFDESLDKKKYLIRMQSKPSPTGTHLATLGNELNLEDGHGDKLLTSSGSSSANEPSGSALSASTSSSTTSSSGPYTEILFKTKSSNEMKRLFGLLQWKDSLNYDDVSPWSLGTQKPPLTLSLSPGTGPPGQTTGGAPEDGCQCQLSGRSAGRWSGCRGG